MIARSNSPIIGWTVKPLLEIVTNLSWRYFKRPQIGQRIFYSVSPLKSSLRRRHLPLLLLLFIPLRIDHTTHSRIIEMPATIVTVTMINILKVNFHSQQHHYPLLENDKTNP